MLYIRAHERSNYHRWLLFTHRILLRYVFVMASMVCPNEGPQLTSPSIPMGSNLGIFKKTILDCLTDCSNICWCIFHISSLKIYYFRHQNTAETWTVDVWNYGEAKKTFLCSINASLQNIVNISSSMSKHSLINISFSTFEIYIAEMRHLPPSHFSQITSCFFSLTPWWGLTQRSKTIECVLDHSGGRGVEGRGFGILFFEDHLAQRSFGMNQTGIRFVQYMLLQ